MDFPKLNAKFYPGDTITHPVLGIGSVIGVSPSGKLLVKFKTVTQTVKPEDCNEYIPRGNA